MPETIILLEENIRGYLRNAGVDNSFWATYLKH